MGVWLFFLQLEIQSSLSQALLCSSVPVGSHPDWQRGGQVERTVPWSPLGNKWESSQCSFSVRGSCRGFVAGSQNLLLQLASLWTSVSYLAMCKFKVELNDYYNILLALSKWFIIKINYTGVVTESAWLEFVWGLFGRVQTALDWHLSDPPISLVAPVRVRQVTPLSFLLVDNW